MKTVDILGVSVDALTAPEAVVHIRQGLEAGKRLQVVTVNNEMVMRAKQHPDYKKTINAADLRVADTAGLVWAAHYQRRPSGYLRAVRTLFQLLLVPSTVRTELPETIPGSDLAVDLAGMCEEFGYRMFLVGAGDGVAEAAGKELQQRFPRLKMAGAISGGDGLAAGDEELRETITKADAQVILVAYGQPKQEEWMARNIPHLPAPVMAVGIGGTLDYLAGAASVEGGRPAKQPPAAVRKRGLEWLWRLFTQPSRWRRIFTAFPAFVRAVVRSGKKR